MPRDLTLAMAGHIDHGKTTLVRALTGTQGDRLPEEKARGITINLGYAHFDLGDYRLGVIDVPGHERFVKNMLAGVTSIDLAVLVVAATDGVMPQTREHLAILDLLDVRAGVVALTNVDQASPESREAAEAGVRELVRGTFLEAAPVVGTAAPAGVGVDELKAALLNQCERAAARDGAAPFRLAIDRAFAVEGHGTVVTGTVSGGSLAAGEPVEWFASDGSPRTLRVRGLARHGTPTDRVAAGQRAALNLAGIELSRVERGQELASPGFLAASRVLSVQLRALPDAPRPLKHRLTVRVHLGTAEVRGQVSLLDCDRIDPGGTGYGQLFLERPVTATHGQRYVLRSDSAEETLAGGRVVQPEARKLRRRHVESLERLELLDGSSPAGRAAAATWFAGFVGARPADWVRTASLGEADSTRLAAELTAAGAAVPVPLGPNQVRLLASEWVAEGEARIAARLAGLHAGNPLMTNHDRAALLASLAPALDLALGSALVERMAARKELVADARRVARADFRPKLSSNQRKLKDKLVEAYRAGGATPPEPAGFLKNASVTPAILGDIYEVACAEGLLVKVARDLYLDADAYRAARETLMTRLADAGRGTMADIRDWLGTSRKYAIPLCEHFDREGVTARDGDYRTLGPFNGMGRPSADPGAR